MRVNGAFKGKYEASTGPSGNIVITNSSHMNEARTFIAESQNCEVVQQWSRANNCRETDDAAHSYRVRGAFGHIFTKSTWIHDKVRFHHQPKTDKGFLSVAATSQVAALPLWRNNNEVRVSTAPPHAAGEQAVVIAGIYFIKEDTRR